MISLSLLPPEKKQEIARRRRLTRWIWLILLAGCVIAVSTATFLVAKSLLIQRLERIRPDVQQNSGGTRPSSQPLETKISGYLALTPTPADIRQSHTALLADIIRLVPTEITIQRLTSSFPQDQILIQGTAETRTAFIQFQDGLKQLAVVERLETPLSALAQKESIEFVMTVTVKP